MGPTYLASSTTRSLEPQKTTWFTSQNSLRHVRRIFKSSSMRQSVQIKKTPFNVSGGATEDGCFSWKLWLFVQYRWPEVKSSRKPRDDGVHHHDLPTPPWGPQDQRGVMGGDQRWTLALVQQSMSRINFTRKSLKVLEVSQHRWIRPPTQSVYALW